MSKAKARRKALKAVNASRAARMRGKVTLPQWDHGAMGQANRIGLVVEERADVDPETGKRVNPNGVTGARRVDMLEVYHKRGVISARGYMAGLHLRQAWLKTEMGQCSPFAREAVDTSLKLDATMAVMVDRISSYKKANSFTSAGDSSILSVVICSGASVGSIKEYRGEMHEVGLVHLRDAMDRLADRMEGRSVSAET